MPVYTIETPDGRKLTIEADSEADALRGAQEWGAQNGVGSGAQQRYDSALENVRQSQFSDFTPEQFQQVANTQFQPYNFQGVAQNAQTFGFGDEINAGMGALGSQVRNWLGGGGQNFGEAYSTYEALEQARRDLGREQLGWGAPVADIVGGFSGLGPARTATGAVAPAAVSLTSPQAMANAVIGGTGLGFLGGFGSTDGGLPERTESGAIGAGVGATIGRFGPTIANAAGSTYGNIANMLSRNQAAAQAGIDPGVARYITQALQADDALSPQGFARMQAAGGQGMLVDAAPSTRTMLDTAIQSSGAAGRTARDAIQDRLAVDSASISEALNNTLGMPEGVTSARARIASETAGDRGQAYRDAYNAPIDYSSQSGLLLDELLARVPQEVINRANRLMSIRGENSRQIMAQIADDGTVTYMQQPDVRQIDYITRALNEEASAGIGQGAMGGQTDLGSSLQSLSGDIRNVLGNHVPEYRTALDTAGDAIQRSRAVQLGADILNPSLTMDDVIRQSQNLSDAERQGIATGLRSQIDNLMARVRRTLGNPDTETREAAKALVSLSDRATRTKIEAAIGEDLANQIFQELDRAGMSFELASSVANNSQTFARQNQQQVVNDMAGGDGILWALRRGQPLNAGQRATQVATNATDAAVSQRADDINNQIVRMLVARGPQAQANWQTMNSLANQTFGNDAVSRALAASLGQAALPSSLATQRYIAGSN